MVIDHKKKRKKIKIVRKLRNSPKLNSTWLVTVFRGLLITCACPYWQVATEAFVCAAFGGPKPKDR